MIQHRGRRRVRDEGGQVTTALVIMMSVFLIAVAIWGVAALGRGTDEKSQAQSAADAAALAGADVLGSSLSTVLALLTSKDGLGSLTGCAFGQEHASTYAQKNGASLTSYCFDLARGRVDVEVRMNEPVSEQVGPAVASAAATTGLELGSCSWTDEEPPEPSPTPSQTPDPSDGPGEPDPSAEPTTPPPPDLGTTLSCGPITAEFTIDGETGRLSLVSADVHGLRPSLID